LTEEPPDNFSDKKALISGYFVVHYFNPIPSRDGVFIEVYLMDVRQSVPRCMLAVTLLLGVSLTSTTAKAHSRARMTSKPRTGVLQTTKTHKKKVSSKRRGAWKRHGQQGIDEQRAREIQTALIREKYLDGEPTGQWDQHTKDAITRFQADHGWQTKVTPDARALIALGLGPKHENVLNPESLAAMPAIAVPNPAPGNAAGTPRR
jgi:peptidoglycan hydrolase-like protein with peptidoglycan-binding domain